MATKPKKSSTSSSLSKKKLTSKKKNGIKKRKKKRSIIAIFMRIIIVLFLMVLLGLIVYLVWYKEDEFFLNTDYKVHYSTQELLNDLAAIKVKKPKEVQKNLDTRTVEPKKISKTTLYKERGQKTVTTIVKKKPKLAILIDDVHTKAQIRAIKNLGLKITPSIFPPYTLSPKSHLLAKKVKHSMVHLPMESSSKQFNKQTKTLMTSFSNERIVDRVMEIRRLFPHAKYINNHTGSVFTSDYKAMKKLYIALKMEGFIFVDSATVSTSKVKQILNEFGDTYMKRDVFIDNIHTIKSIHKQLKLAVKQAKEKGHVIAIGHPHKVTLKALASANAILKDVELVYIDEIYKRK